MAALTRLRSVVSTVLLVGALGLAVAMLAPAVFGFERYVITGHSMEPTIHKGALVFSKQVKGDELDRGDVITYTPPPGAQPRAHAVTHRIVKKGRDKNGPASYVTQGDNNKAADPWKFTLAGTGAAQHKFDIPYVGYVFTALSIRWVRMLAIGLPALLIGLAAVRKLWVDAGAELAAREAAASEAT